MCRQILVKEEYQIELDIIKEINARRIRWLGHVFRTSEQRPCGMLTLAALLGSKRVGRPQHFCRRLEKNDRG
jgi:hypothetical protein